MTLLLHDQAKCLHISTRGVNELGSPDDRSRWALALPHGGPITRTGRPGKRFSQKGGTQQ